MPQILMTSDRQIVDVVAAEWSILPDGRCVNGGGEPLPMYDGHRLSGGKPETVRAVHEHRSGDKADEPRYLSFAGNVVATKPQAEPSTRSIR